MNQRHSRAEVNLSSLIQRSSMTLISVKHSGNPPGNIPGEHPKQMSEPSPPVSHLREEGGMSATCKQTLTVSTGGMNLGTVSMNLGKTSRAQDQSGLPTSPLVDAGLTLQEAPFILILLLDPLAGS